MRRSSASRSIGNRSDFSATVFGDGESVAILNEDEPTNQTAHREADDHVSNYVASQLQRARDHASIGAYEDEFEAQLDDHAIKTSRNA
jgi:hypothetical protein